MGKSTIQRTIGDTFMETPREVATYNTAGSMEIDPTPHGGRKMEELPPVMATFFEKLNEIHVLNYRFFWGI